MNIKEIYNWCCRWLFSTNQKTILCLPAGRPSHKPTPKKQRPQKRVRYQEAPHVRHSLIAYQAKIKRFHKAFLPFEKNFDKKLSAKRLFQCFIQGDVDAVCKSYAERLSKLRGILRQLKTIAYSCFGAENQKDFDRFMSNLCKSLTANAESLGMLPKNQLILENLLDLIGKKIRRKFKKIKPKPL